ncbi:MAG: glycoside hydrolase family 88 protein [Clostridia bacterium]|nr:glycoside hydrolase family 88 protein [Clostridia bacterium]
MESILNANKAWIDETWDKMVEKLRKVSVSTRNKLPHSTVDGVYDDKSGGLASSWTNGFWPGIMWLMYAGTGEDTFRKTAENGEEILDKALACYNVLHHDVGFMWHISAGANYRLTGNEKSKNRNLHAAAALAARYNVNGEFIKAWNEEGFEGWVIIDSMMNIPLLYWAEKETNNIAFRQIAMHHADKTMEHHIRPDGSVYHIMDYDINTGECNGPARITQGYEPKTSSWSRGQAWAIYGFVLSYLHTGEQRYLDTAKKVAHYFISAIIPDNFVPRSDFRAPEEPIYYDTSAAAIAACGLIEIAKAVPEFEKKMYMQAAVNIMKALVEKHCDFTDKDEAILQNCTGSYGEEVHYTCVYGEYYFVEAMYKLKGFEPLFW